jgi:tripartite-type tricarboxylate transporter receptor subunit TctC
LGQPIIIENRAGAAGTVGAGVVTKAAPDGYTLMVSAVVHLISPYILKETRFDPVADFTGITEIAEGPLMISASKNVQANNIAEFITQAKQDPEKFVFSTSGYGASGHLAVELLRRIVSADSSKTTLVNFNGAAPALNQLLVGSIDVLIDPVLSSYQIAHSDRAKVLGLTGAHRIPLLPNVPTVVELGYPELEFYSWYGLWGPKGLPKAIAERMAQEMKKIVAMPDVQKKLADSGFESVASDPETFSAYLISERSKYQRILREIGIQAR